MTLFMAALALFLPNQMPEPAARGLNPAPAPASATETPPVVRMPPMSARRPCARGCLSPVEAVTYATYLAPRAAVAAEFELEIKGVGSQDRRFFLNSEADYRDRNCLTLVLSPPAAKALAGSADVAALEKRFKGKRITVEGLARRVRIDFTENGKPTGKYYYQVHVTVMDARQIIDS